MSERASFRGAAGGGRGGRGGGRGGDGVSRGGGARGGSRGGGGGQQHGGGRGGGYHHHHHHHQNQSGGGGGAGGAGGASSGSADKPKKENILDLAKYMDKGIRVKFSGGREAVGTLKGYDQLMNLVLDDVKEIMRDDEGVESSRSLGLLVARGTMLVLISPLDGSQEIANPFMAPDSADDAPALPS